MDNLKYVVHLEYNPQLPWKFLTRAEAFRQIQLCIDEHWDGDLEYAVNADEIALLVVREDEIGYADICAFYEENKDILTKT